MTSYTVWNGTIPSGTSSTATGARTDGITFSVTSGTGSPTLEAVGFYVPSGETTLAGSSYEALVYTTTAGTAGTLVTSQAGTGTFVAGAWNWITLSSPVALSTGVFYVAAVSSPDMIQFEHTYWGAGNPGAGGVTSGPVFVPDGSGAPGSVQQGFDAAASTFPGQYNGSWYGIDVQVTASSGSSHTASAALAVTPALSAARVAGRVRSAALALAVALSAAAGVSRPRSASLTISPSLSVSSAAAHVRAASLTISPSFSAAAAQVRGRGAALAVTPLISAAALRGRYGAAALAVTPVLSSGATSSASRTRTAALTVAPVLHAAAQHTGSGALIASWPDVERALGDFLAPLGTTGSETRPTLQTTLPYIRITRTGGSDDRVSDRANVSIDVFAADRSAAKETAGQVREYLLTRLSAQTDHGLLDWASTQTGPAVLPATDSDNLRLAVASYTVSMRRTAQ